MPLIEDQTKQIIATLSDCLVKCSACARDCANQGEKDLPKCIALGSDCAEICATYSPDGPRQRSHSGDVQALR